MKKILNAIDFAKGFKTKAGVFLLSVSQVLKLWDIELPHEEITNALFLVLDTLGLFLTSFGGLMALLREFFSKKSK